MIFNCIGKEFFQKLQACFRYNWLILESHFVETGLSCISGEFKKLFNRILSGLAPEDMIGFTLGETGEKFAVFALGYNLYASQSMRLMLSKISNTNVKPDPQLFRKIIPPLVRFND